MVLSSAASSWDVMRRHEAANEEKENGKRK
jgi:hypothetical protein